MNAAFGFRFDFAAFFRVAFFRVAFFFAVFLARFLAGMNLSPFCGLVPIQQRRRRVNI
jgi:hypothetical protein